jgi:hypothetical protein
VPAGRAERTKMRALCGFLIQMKGLRIETARKTLDVFSEKSVFAEFTHVADLYVIKEFHSAATLFFFPNIPG